VTALLAKISSPKLIFRDNAIKNLNSFIDVNEALTIVKPSAWLTLFCLGILLTSLLVWGIWGTVEVTVPAVGIIIADEELQKAEDLWNENINDHKEKLNILYDLFNKQKNLYRQRYITITQLENAREQYLSAKDELAALARQNAIAVFRPSISAVQHKSNETLDALIFVSHSQGKKVTAGMNTYILPNTLSAYEYGYLKGKVISVSDYPAAKDTVYGYLGNMSLVDEFFSGGAPFVVKVRLVKDSATASGLSWISKNGPRFAIEAGTTVSVKIVNKACSPAALIFKTVFS
jgi:hypothetical protein